MSRPWAELRSMREEFFSLGLKVSTPVKRNAYSFEKLIVDSFQSFWFSWQQKSVDFTESTFCRYKNIFLTRLCFLHNTEDTRRHKQSVLCAFGLRRLVFVDVYSLIALPFRNPEVAGLNPGRISDVKKMPNPSCFLAEGGSNQKKNDFITLMLISFPSEAKHKHVLALILTRWSDV